MNYRSIIYIVLCLSFNYTYAQEKDFLDFYKSKKTKLRGVLQYGLNGVSETNLFWNLADVPNVNFNSDTKWLETYLKAGAQFSTSFGKSTFYGKLTGVFSGTVGIDGFDEGNTGRTTLEEGYVAFKTSLSESSLLDISVGPRELKLGTGMLISNGGVSGFERGALKFGPRKAWEMAAIGHLKIKDVNFKTFYIQPNELPSNDTENAIAGVDFNITKNPNKFIGVSYLNVVNSNAPYPQAAPGGNGAPVINFGGREGLNALSFYAKSYPFKKLKNLFTSFDYAYQWNERIDLNAWAGRVQLGYDFKKTTWTPTLMFHYQLFTGDDPDTPGLERFDPLYYEGSPSAWSTGTKSSMVFINSNLKAFGVTLRMMPSPKDILTVRYTNVSVHELRSPIQFGQAARVEFSDGIPTVVAGVTEPNLADDIFIEYNRIISRNIFFNAGVAVSFSGNGINNITSNTSPWNGGYVNIVFNY